jgi:hypothetical protein
LNSPEGIEALCSDVGVDHTDVRILMLAWYAVFCGHFTGPIIHSDLYPMFIINALVYILYRKMKAERQGYFSKVSLRVASPVAIITCILISWLPTI